MKNQNQNEVVEKQEDNKGKEGKLGNYFQYVMQVIKEPDHLLSDETQGKQQFGLITLIAFLGLILLSNVIGIFTYLDALRYLGFSDYFNYFERTIAYAVALALLLFVLKNVANKNGKTYDLNFFFEKLGALLVFPSILLLVSIPLELVDITIYSWFSSLAYTFLYLSIFLISYFFVAKNNLKTAVLFVAGFYFVYRLIFLIL
ncbi:hypothetical protein [Oceanobacillus polygoni]|uniref:Yip1 domain-containing protein n=1 Tax=Oceanobacillus polygoni TaxID=1235259 RepID=A0A9X0YN41_9BACI|nr:hypothetical protein [Oceanobacillus polygoni]MBP2075840.1 hypothetical protein [Oceanobacillus polygoni]